MRQRWRERRLQTRIRDAVDLLYGRPGTDDELAELRDRLGEDPNVPPLRVLRAASALLDHQEHPTAVTVRFGPDDVGYIELDTGVELAVDAWDESVSYPITERSYEAHVRAALDAVLQPGMTFVDVGANIGFYTVLAAHAVGPTGTVHSIEPSSENCRLILLSVDRNDLTNVHLHPVALGATTGHSLFHTHLGTNGGLATGQFDIVTRPSTQVVPLARLDGTVTGPVDVMKIDVEGAEALVLEGGRTLIDREGPVVVSEFSQDMLQRVSGVTGTEYLTMWTDLGYTPHLIPRGGQTVEAIDDCAAFVDGLGLYDIEDLLLTRD